MTPEEAIKSLQNIVEYWTYKPTEVEVAKMAIAALEEVQQYREIGTVEQVRNQKENLNITYKIISDYESCGTVEECREAVEKQKPKKPHRNYKKFSGLWCKCGWYLGQKQCLDIKYCPNCGQAINENLEGMEWLK